VLSHPFLHGGEQRGGELSIASEQLEVSLLRFSKSIEPKVRVAALLDGLRIVRFQLERAIVGRERRIVVAEFAIGIPDVVPGLVVRWLQLRGAGEFLHRRVVSLLRLGTGLRLLAFVGLTRCISGEPVRLFDQAYTGVVVVASLLLGRSGFVETRCGAAGSILRRLASAGATVVVNYVSQAKAAEDLVASLVAAGGKAEAVSASP